MIIIQNATFATGEEMFQNGYAIQNSDNTWTMWIKWHWFPSKEYPETFAPIVECFTHKQDNSTHKASGEEIYFTLNTDKDTGKFFFEDFINKHIKIETI